MVRQGTRPGRMPAAVVVHTVGRAPALARDVAQPPARGRGPSGRPAVARHLAKRLARPLAPSSVPLPLDP